MFVEKGYELRWTDVPEFGIAPPSEDLKSSERSRAKVNDWLEGRPNILAHQRDFEPGP
jgi:hypothetical protein